MDETQFFIAWTQKRRGESCPYSRTQWRGHQTYGGGGWATDAYMEYIDLALERRVANVVKFMEEADKLADEAFLELENDDDDFEF